MNGLNPLDWRGPAFLALYGALIVLGCVALVVRRRLLLGPPADHLPRVDDPLLIACLRGGPAEAIRVATLALMDRGLVVEDGGRLRRRDTDAPDLASRPIEQAVLRRLREPMTPVALTRDAFVLAQAEELRRELERMGLVPDAAQRRAMLGGVVAVTLALVALGLAKILVGLSRDRPVGFLVILTLAMPFALYALGTAARTPSGSRLLSSLRVLFGRLASRAPALVPGASTDELALLLAVHGMAAAPATIYPFVGRVFGRRETADGGVDSTSGCGSGSGCGGGGGCGGCGS